MRMRPSALFFFFSCILFPCTNQLGRNTLRPSGLSVAVNRFLAFLIAPDKRAPLSLLFSETLEECKSPSRQHSPRFLLPREGYCLIDHQSV